MVYIFFMFLFVSSLYGMEAQEDLNKKLLDAVTFERDIEMVKEFLHKGADPSYSPEGDTMLGLVLMRSCPKEPKNKMLVQLLLDYGVDPNGVACRYPDHNCSYLRYASSRGLPDCVLILLAYGADPRGIHIAHIVGQCEQDTGEQAPGKNYMEILRALLLCGMKDDESVAERLPADSECRKMLEDFEQYKDKCPEKFVTIENELLFLERMKKFRKEAKRRGVFNVLHGIK